jgi:hypothetical protein
MTGPTFSDQSLIDDTAKFLAPLDPMTIKKIMNQSNSTVNRELQAADCLYFVLGNYDKYKKPRLETVVAELTDDSTGEKAFLLEDIDPNVTIWENFYVKFRVFLARATYVVLVAEDNDGGHELELGEVDLSTTYILKRDYDAASLDPPTADGSTAAAPKFGDLDHQMFDSMILTLFSYMEQEGRLYTWDSVDALISATRQLRSDTNTNV